VSAVRKAKLVARLLELHERIAPGAVGDIYLSRTDLGILLKSLGATLEKK
jgi:hypothetical protein